MLSVFTEFGAGMYCVQTEWDILFLRLSSPRDNREIFFFQGVITMPADYNRVKEELKFLHVAGAFSNSKGYATINTNAFTCTGELISP